MNDWMQGFYIAISAMYTAMPFVVALLLGLAIPAGIALSSTIAEKWSDGNKIAVVLGVLVLGNALSIALSGRSLYTEAELAANPMLGQNVEQGGLSSWGGRLSTGIILFVSSGEVARWLLRRRKMPSNMLFLWAAFMAFYIASYWLGVMFATSREIPPSWIYAPITFTALALMAPTGCADALPKVRWALFAVLASSLLAALVVPDMMMERGYKSLIPGFTRRLYGLAEHANTLGAIAGLAVIMELSPFIRKRPNYIFLAVAVIALVLTQSKTAWVLALIGGAMVRVESFRQLYSKGRQANFSMLLILVTSLGLSALLLAFMFGNRGGAVEAFFNRADITTLTGRTQIWAVSWEEFVENPLFGYGPAIWDMRYRFDKGLVFAGQAHGQFFQTMGQAGLFGLVTLFAYLWAMGSRCVRAWGATSGFAVIAFISLLVRCLSESPMRLSGLLGMDAFVHLLAFCMAGTVLLQESSRPRIGVGPRVISLKA